MHPWWIFCRDRPQFTPAVRSVMALLLGTQPKSMQCNFSGSPCGMCGVSIKEDGKHILFECEALCQVRAACWERIMNDLPPAMARDLTESQAKDRARLIIAGPGQRYIPEWADVYQAFSCFVYHIYRARKSLYNSYISPLAQQ